MGNQEPLFVVGCYRSGTSLMRLILNAHSEIAISEETRLIPPVGMTFERALTQLSKVEAEQLVERLLSHLHRLRWTDLPDIKDVLLRSLEPYSYANILKSIFAYPWQKENLVYVGDNTPDFLLNVPFMIHLFKSCKFINMVRDVRDVAASANKISFKFGRSIGHVGLDWNERIYTAQIACNIVGQNNFINVKYEDLVTNPEKTVSKVCRFLGVEFESSMLEYYLGSEAINLAKQSHHVNVIRPINSKSVGSYKLILSEKEIEILERICSTNLYFNNYQVLHKYGRPLYISERAAIEVKTLFLTVQNKAWDSLKFNVRKLKPKNLSTL